MANPGVEAETLVNIPNFLSRMITITIYIRDDNQLFPVTSNCREPFIQGGGSWTRLLIYIFFLLNWKKLNLYYNFINEYNYVKNIKIYLRFYHLRILFYHGLLHWDVCIPDKSLQPNTVGWIVLDCYCIRLLLYQILKRKIL